VNGQGRSKGGKGVPRPHAGLPIPKVKEIKRGETIEHNNWTDLKHELQFRLAFRLVAELINEDAAKVETARVPVSLIQLHHLLVRQHVSQSRHSTCHIYSMGQKSEYPTVSQQIVPRRLPIKPVLSDLSVTRVLPHSL